MIGYDHDDDDDDDPTDFPPTSPTFPTWSDRQILQRGSHAAGLSQRREGVL